MCGETPHLLQVRDKCSDFVAGDVTQMHTALVTTEEPLKVFHTVCYDHDGIGAFPLGRCTKLVAGDEAFWVRWLCYGHLVSPQIFDEASALLGKSSGSVHPG